MQSLPTEDLIERNQELFYQVFFSTPEFISMAPGRINIIGEHTDYNFGLAMPAAINRWVLVSLAKRNDHKVHVKSINYNSDLVFSLGESPLLTESWQKYVYGTIEVFREKYSISKGFNAVIYGNVPLGFGVSSSAAIEVSMINGLKALYKAPLDELQIVKLCQRVEHEHLHLKSGLLDQYASQFSRKGKVMVLDFNSMSHQYVNMENDRYEWVLVNSGITRELAHSGYSERVRETQVALDFLKGINPEALYFLQGREIKSFRDLELSHVDLLPDPTSKKRIKHYVSENQRVQQAVECLAQNNFKKLGEILCDSHTSLSEDYEVSCMELDYLTEAAMEHSSCLGSRIMGGGFGGCTLNLVDRLKREEFSTHIQRAYSQKFNIQPAIDSFQLVNGAETFPC
jgi:galactokinase